MMTPVRPDLPSGIVTFLFTDVEGSTKLLRELGSVGYAEALAEHRRILRQAFDTHGGVEVDTQGDAFFVAFPTASGAIEAAADALEGLSSGPIRVRMGIHTGTPYVAEEGYVGHDVNKGARIASAGHGGQVLLSKETCELAHVDVTDLGEHRLKDFEEPVSIFQLGAERFPPLKTISNTNLPRPASSFVGREQEVVQVASRLRGGARLLTLTGPGGRARRGWRSRPPRSSCRSSRRGFSGSASLHFATRRLSPTRSHRRSAPRMAWPSTSESASCCFSWTTSSKWSRPRPTSPRWSRPAPTSASSSTSRELYASGARSSIRSYRSPTRGGRALLPPVREPSQTRPSRELCRALDNLPLALELAAARASVLSPRQILERLSGRLDLLRAAVTPIPASRRCARPSSGRTSCSPPPSGSSSRALGVFAGGCTLEAAEQVTEADLDTLQALVDKSLLRHTEERFWMLETIREYATERLRIGRG